MKRNIFVFLVVIVAISIILRSYAMTVYGPNNPGPAIEYECEGNGILCTFISGPLYTSPIEQNESTKVSIINLAFLKYQF